MDYEDEIDHDVDSIIAQIKNQGRNLKNIEREKPELKKEDLEKFVIDTSAAVVADAVEMFQSLKTDVLAGADSRTIEATAELLKAITGAVDSLAKLKINEDKLKGQKEIKQMDIDAKKIGDEESKNGLYISREDVVKHLLNKPPVEEKTEKVIEI